MPQKIVIVDYGMGNIQSVFRKFLMIGITPVVSNDPVIIKNADKLILPGVGHFGKAMSNLVTLGLFDNLNETVLVRKTPILGICLGMQLMTNGSEEGNSAGFGWIDAEVRKFRVSNKLEYKVPHVGWNQIEIVKESRLMGDIANNSEFYFVHSYVCKCNNEEDILNVSNYEMQFVSAFEKENIFGVQYHPEKSFDVGKRLIHNFIQLNV